MSRNMQTSVSSVVTQHSQRKQPTVKVLGYALAGDGLARIFAEVTHNQHSREDHSLVAESLSSIFDRKLACVSGSFHSVDKAPYSERLEGVMRVNTESVAFTEGMNGFRSVSSNIFMDDEEKMWALRKTEAGDILVKGTGIEDHESLRGLLDVVCSGGYSLSSEYRKAMSSVSSMQAQVTGGSFVGYVSSTSNEVKFGFVVASDETDGKLIVIPTDAGDEDEGEVVDREAVTADYDTEEFPEPEMSEQEQMDQAVCAARGVADLTTLLAFYKKVFARSPAFYAEFAKRARAHVFM